VATSQFAVSCEKAADEEKEQIMKKIVFALIAGAAFASAAQAQDTTTNAPRSYIGLGVATADHDYSLNGVNNPSSDGYKASAKVFGGYEFNNMWGVEAGYTDFRKSSFNYTTNNGIAGSGNADGHAYYVAGKATAPINDQFAVFGKLGVENSHRSFGTNTGLSGSSNRRVRWRWPAVQPEQASGTDRRVRALRQVGQLRRQVGRLDRGRALQLLSASRQRRKNERAFGPFFVGGN
jgi:OOP family OmpA-OmpF porin